MGRWRCAGLMLALTPLLAGCMSLDAHLDIGTDETVDYRVDLTISKEYLMEVGLTGDLDLCQEIEGWFPAGTSWVPTTSDEASTCRITGSSPIAEFGRTEEDGRSGLIIVRGDGEYVFSWAPLPGGDAADQIEHFEVSVSFPGLVTDHSGSGSVWLNTVTWRDPADLFTTDGLMARGADQPHPVLALLPVVGLLVGLGLVVWLGGAIVRRRSASHDEPADWPAPDPATRMPVVPDPAVLAPRDAERAWQPPPPPPQAWAPTPQELHAPEPGPDWSPSDDPRPDAGGGRPPPDADQEWLPPAPLSRPPLAGTGPEDRAQPEPSPWGPPQ